MAFKCCGSVPACVVHRSGKQGHAHAGAAVLAADREAGHPPGVLILDENAAQRLVVQDAGECPPRHDTGPSHWPVINVGEKPYRHAGGMQLALECVSVGGRAMHAEPLAPARCRVRRLTPEGSCYIIPPILGRRLDAQAHEDSP